MPKAYETPVIKEGGFVVELSNKGDLKKENPNPLNYKGETIKCKFPGCTKTLHNKFGTCSVEHRKHPVDWIGRIFKKEEAGENHKYKPPYHYVITESLIKWADNRNERIELLDKFMNDVWEKISSMIPDATTLQDIYEGRVPESEDYQGPGKIVQLVNLIVDTHFPKDEWGTEKIDLTVFKKPENPNGPNIKVTLEDVPIRIIATLLVVAYACEEANRCDAWFYKVNDLGIENSKRASVYMPAVYYLLRRHTKATLGQGRKSLVS